MKKYYIKRKKTSKNFFKKEDWNFRNQNDQVYSKGNVMRLKDKVVIVTGAGRGIGKALATGFAAEGAITYCLARSKDEIDKTVKTIAENGGIGFSYCCDVTNYMNLKMIFDEIGIKHTKIDLVVINAGIDKEHKPVETIDIEDWNAVINVNLNGAFYTAKVAIPYLKKSDGGKIITIGSGMGHKGRADSAAYSCSKAGLWMLTRVLSQELFEFGISVNELIPGPVITTMGDECKKDSSSTFSNNNEWIKQPEDVIEMALFLATQPSIGPSAQSFSLMRRDI